MPFLRRLIFLRLSAALLLDLQAADKPFLGRTGRIIGSPWRAARSRCTRSRRTARAPRPARRSSPSMTRRASRPTRSTRSDSPSTTPSPSSTSSSPIPLLARRYSQLRENGLRRRLPRLARAAGRRRWSAIHGAIPSSWGSTGWARWIQASHSTRTTRPTAADTCASQPRGMSWSGAPPPAPAGAGASAARSPAPLLRFTSLKLLRAATTGVRDGGCGLRDGGAGVRQDQPQR